MLVTCARFVSNHVSPIPFIYKISLSKLIYDWHGISFGEPVKYDVRKTPPTLWTEPECQLKCSFITNIGFDRQMDFGLCQRSRELAVYAEIRYAPPGNPRCTNVGGSNVICHLFPTRHIYAHKSFPTLCLAGFLVIIGHLCHSHPVHCLGNTLTALSFVVTSSLRLPLSNLAARKPAPCVSTIWPALSNLAGLWKVVVGPGFLAVFWNMPTGAPFFSRL